MLRSFPLLLLLLLWPLHARAQAAELARVREAPALASDARAIDELVRAADAAPPSAIRVDAWVLAAEAYAQRLDRPADAERLYRKIAADPFADPVIARKASRDLVTLLLARGDLDGAKEAARGDAKLAAEVARAARRRYLHFASIALLAAVVLLSASALARSGTTRARAALGRVARLAIAYAAYVALAGAALASRYEGGNARPFLLFGAALFPLLLIARAWAAAGASSPRARAARALVCAGGVLGAAFLVLEHVDVAYLEGMGL